MVMLLVAKVNLVALLLTVHVMSSYIKRVFVFLMRAMLM